MHYEILDSAKNSHLNTLLYPATYGTLNTFSNKYLVYNLVKIEFYRRFCCIKYCQKKQYTAACPKKYRYLWI